MRESVISFVQRSHTIYKHYYNNDENALYLVFLYQSTKEVIMDALTMTILLGVLVMLVVIIAFVLTVKSGQYDDLDSPAHRILMDDDDPRIPGNRNKNNK